MQKAMNLNKFWSVVSIAAGNSISLAKGNCSRFSEIFIF